MRRELYLLAVITLSILPTVSALGQPAAAVDLSMRRALYFTGNETQKIDKTGKYVAENGTMVLNQSQATKCEQDGCYFNVGFMVFRKPAAGELITYATLKTQTSYVAGIEVIFANNEAIKEKILSLKLGLGANQVTFRVDPYQKIAESDEGNNSFAVTITVKPKAVLSNPNAGKPEPRNAHARRQGVTDSSKGLIDSGNVFKAFHKDNNESSFKQKTIKATKSFPPAPSVRDMSFAHGFQSNLSCPETIVVGVINPPTDWTDYGRRVVPFENLKIVQTAQGAKISCDYDQGRYAVDRLVPGRVCTRDGATSPHISCRVIPTKK